MTCSRFINLWTLFALVQTEMFCLFTFDQSNEQCLDLFRLDNILFVHTWSILWTLFGLVQTRPCFVCSDFGWYYEHYFNFVLSYALSMCDVVYKHYFWPVKTQYNWQKLFWFVLTESDSTGCVSTCSNLMQIYIVFNYHTSYIACMATALNGNFMLGKCDFVENWCLTLYFPY